MAFVVKATTPPSIHTLLYVNLTVMVSPVFFLLRRSLANIENCYSSREKTVPSSVVCMLLSSVTEKKTDRRYPLPALFLHALSASTTRVPGKTHREDETRALPPAPVHASCDGHFWWPDCPSRRHKRRCKDEVKQCDKLLGLKKQHRLREAFIFA